MKLNSRTYLNLILTLIALVLLVLAAQLPVRMNLESSAYGQEKNVQQREYLAETTANVGSAQATEKVAEANMEIARQIGEVAKALNSVSKSIDNFTVSQRPQR